MSPQMSSAVRTKTELLEPRASQWVIAPPERETEQSCLVIMYKGGLALQLAADSHVAQAGKTAMLQVDASGSKRATVVAKSSAHQRILFV